MEVPLNPSANQSTYFINPEEAEETARLLLQDRLLTKEMGGVFPEGLDFKPSPSCSGPSLRSWRMGLRCGSSWSPDGCHWR